MLDGMELVLNFCLRFAKKKYDPSITLWEVNEADNFLELQFGARHERSTIAYSSNPYLSLIEKEYI